MLFERYVAIGDSFTEGCGDHDPRLPNGVRGWADRVAEVLAERAREAGRDFSYANLAIRGRKLEGVLTEQLDPALAMRPDLVTCYAGANDILRLKVDVEAMVRRYELALRPVAESGARLVLFTAVDPGSAFVYRPVRERFARYGELVRAAADRLGADVVDFWEMKDYQSWGYWDADRMHMASVGHQRMAVEVLDVLGVPHDVPRPADPGVPTRSVAARLIDDAAWVRRDLAPWVGRRIMRTSTGDRCAPRWPAMTDPVSS